jgi:hypothetical protein
MYFYTYKPKLFNIETGVCMVIEESNTVENVFVVKLVHYLEELVFSGTHKECQEFVFAAASHVGATNLEAKMPH